MQQRIEDIADDVVAFFTSELQHCKFVIHYLCAVFCWVWGEEGAGCFVWVEMELVLLCP